MPISQYAAVGRSSVQNAVNNFMLYLRAKSFNLKLQLLVKLRVNGTYLFYMLK
jgi:hypothetical protein